MSVFFYRGFRHSTFVYAIMTLACIHLQAQNKYLEPVKIKIDSKIVISHIPMDFIGFGYETSAVAQSDYFGSKNTTLINLYKNLSPHGLIRIGGNISDHTRYIPTGTSEVHTEKNTTIINHANLVNLASFSRATGWKVMWGLNLGAGSKESAVQEAIAVQDALGNYLQSFQVGNEVDLRHLYAKKYTNFDSYYSHYLAYREAIRKSLPQAKFSGPDVAGNLSWLEAFANAQAKYIQLLTYHYYRTGANNQNATIITLLQKDTGWNRRLEKLRQISKNNNVPFRINEVNSFSGGGKPGVSDTFASALWCLDYMFELASYGCNGVNVETDINQHAWISHYSPIVHNSAGYCSARPEYYGMLAFALAGNGDLIKSTLVKKVDINLSAYATKMDNKYVWVTIINKDLSQDAKVEINLPEGYKNAKVFRLNAPSVKSKDHVSLASAEVSPDGKWIPKSKEKIAIKEDEASLLVPHSSAVLLRFQH